MAALSFGLKFLAAILLIPFEIVTTSCFILAHFLCATASSHLRNSGECLNHGILLFLAFAIELNLGSLQHKTSGWLQFSQTQIYCQEIGISLLFSLIYLLPHLFQAPSLSTYPPSLTLLQRLSGLLFDFTAFHSIFAHKTTLLLQSEILFSLLSYPKYA